MDHIWACVTFLNKKDRESFESTLTQLGLSGSKIFAYDSWVKRLEREQTGATAGGVNMVAGGGGHITAGEASACLKKLRTDLMLYFGYIPEYRTVFADYGEAITVHKAQGSEWDHVAILWGSATWSWYYSEKDSNAVEQTLWRWIYTAATRAQSSVSIFGAKSTAEVAAFKEKYKEDHKVEITAQDPYGFSRFFKDFIPKKADNTISDMADYPAHEDAAPF